MESGDPDDLDLLLAGLRLRPESLYRASIFTQNPPRAGGEERPQLGWFGWDQQTALLLEIRNLLAGRKTLAGPPTAKPGSADDPAPSSTLEVLQLLRPH